MYNKIALMGRLVADPELKQTPSGVSSCRFSVAVDLRYAKQGEERQTDFFAIQAWRQTAEFICKYFAKGRMIFLDGELRNNHYTDQNGVKHYSDIIVAQSVSFCGDKPAAGGTPQYNPPAAAANPAAPQQSAPAQSAQVQLGNLGDFEEILSDGVVPF